MLESLILGMVINEDLTGYDIKKLIETNIGTFYKASFGSLYPALKRLTQKKSLTSYEKPLGNRKKTFYHITDEGKQMFLQWLTSPMDILDGTNPNLAKIYFFDSLPDKIRSVQLSIYEMNSVSYLKKLETLEKKYDAMENKDCYYYKLSTLYYGICVTKKTIEWCRHINQRRPLNELI